MKYGYCRVSTKAQSTEGNSLEAQEQALRLAGAEVSFLDAIAGSTNQRPKLQELLETLQQGDTLIVTKLDRLSRSTRLGIELIDTLLDKGISVHILNMGLLDDSPTGRLIRTILLAFAEFERDQIVERTQEGKQIARLNPSYKEGRPKKYKREQMNHAMTLMNQYSCKKVSEMTGISERTLYRFKKEITN